MTLTDYLVDSLLVLLVLRQVRESRFGRAAVYLPLGVIAWAMHQYLRTVPTTGNDLPLIAGLAALGIGFGVVSALATRVRTDGGRYALVKAGWVAAGVWVLSMGSRFGFVVWLTHGGGVDVFRWSRAHAVSMDAWTAALLLMALGEVVARTAILLVRTRRALGARPVVAEQLVTA
jgi:hypothetical protein